MSFETDKQTLDDLNLLGKYKNNSVYSLYVGTITRGKMSLMLWNNILPGPVENVLL